jgi:hypothetical protein
LVNGRPAETYLMLNIWKPHEAARRIFNHVINSKDMAIGSLRPCPSLLGLRRTMAAIFGISVLLGSA